MKRGAAIKFRNAGFTLVETVIAIGIFAFVIVGIIGLFPAAVRQQGRSAQETLAVQAIQQIMASLQAASSLSDVNIVTGEENGQLDNELVDFTSSEKPVVVGFRGGSSVPVWYFRDDGSQVWENGLPVTEDAGGTKYLLRAKAEREEEGLYRVDFEVGWPANVPRTVREAQKQVDSFSTKVYAP